MFVSANWLMTQARSGDATACLIESGWATFIVICTHTKLWDAILVQPHLLSELDTMKSNWEDIRAYVVLNEFLHFLSLPGPSFLVINPGRWTQGFHIRTSELGVVLRCHCVIFPRSFAASSFYSLAQRIILGSEQKRILFCWFRPRSIIVRRNPGLHARRGKNETFNQTRTYGVYNWGIQSL